MELGTPGYTPTHISPYRAQWMRFVNAALRAHPETDLLLRLTAFALTHPRRYDEPFRTFTGLLPGALVDAAFALEPPKRLPQHRVGSSRPASSVLAAYPSPKRLQSLLQQATLLAWSARDDLVKEIERAKPLLHNPEVNPRYYVFHDPITGEVVARVVRSVPGAEEVAAAIRKALEQ